MKPIDFDANAPGQLVQNLNGDYSFVPNDLPPDISWDNDLVAITTQATQSVAQLCGLGGRFPNPERLIRLFLRREAELSSRIEQTHASVRTMLLFEHIPGVREDNADVREVQNNYRVLLDGLAAIHERPITLALIRHLHKSLFAGIDATAASPGRLRSIPVFIGATRSLAEARFVPPPPTHVEQCMRSLEGFVRRAGASAAVVRAALAHYQFEAIHPFNDGNGRIGRALIMLMLVKDGLLSVPLLNPSAGLERRRREYYDCLLNVSTNGDWSAWIRFFCTCLAEEAVHAGTLLEKLDRLRASYHEKIRLARSSGLMGKLIDELFAEPAQTGASVAKLLSLTPKHAYRAIAKLESMGVLEEITGRERDRVFLATEIVDLFSASQASSKKRT